jgi:hypothetical protein
MAVAVADLAAGHHQTTMFQWVGLSSGPINFQMDLQAAVFVAPVDSVVYFRKGQLL